MKRKCPTCNSSDGVRIIIWGMPAGEPDKSKYYIGGCLMDDQNPDYKCIKCGWEGFRHSRTVDKSDLTSKLHL
jgi:Zn ribbon nucleic-acid-binding protein